MRVQAWGHGTLLPLVVPDFRRLLVGTVLWWQCFHMEMVVLGWLTFDLTNSPWMVSLVSFCRTLPLLIMGLFSGPIIDYFGRRRVVIAAQCVNLCAYLAMVLLLWNDVAAPWNIALVAFCLGTAWSVDWPTRRALLPDIVGKAKMVDGMLIESFLTGISRIIGPVIAGGLIARFGAVGCYTVMAFLSVTALSILIPLLRTPSARTNKIFPRPPWIALGEGLRYVRSNQTILGVLVVTLIMNMWIFPYSSLLPVFARVVLHRGPVELGFLGTGTGMGSFLGLLLVNQLRRRYQIGMLFVLGTGWICVALAVFALSHYYPFSWAMLFCAGMGMACFGTLQSAIILLKTSDEMRSRVMGILVLAIGGDPLGQLQIGSLAERFGVQATLAGQASAAALVVVLIVLLLPGIYRRERQEELLLEVTPAVQ
ncbi:MAG: MFS transporter [Chloroflexi bacterium]|nr:MFS transporter [Chloroflexota bacterium]